MSTTRDHQLEALKRQLDFDSRQADHRSDRVQADLRDLRSAIRTESHSTQMLVFQMGVYVMLILLIGLSLIASRL